MRSRVSLPMICFRNPARLSYPSIAIVDGLNAVLVGRVAEDGACKSTLLKGRKSVMGRMKDKGWNKRKHPIKALEKKAAGQEAH